MWDTFWPSFSQWFWGIVGALKSDEWSALAAVVTVVLAVVAAVYAAIQLRDGRRIRREQAAPYVIVQFEASQASSKLIDLVIRNIGATPAFDIKLKIEPPMERANEIAGYPFMNARPIANGLKMLAPSQEVRMHFDSLIERNGRGLPSVFEVSVQANDSRGKRLGTGSFELDIDWGRDSVGVEVYNLHRVGKLIAGIEESAKSIATSLEIAHPREKRFRDPVMEIAKPARSAKATSKPDDGSKP